MRPRGPWWQRVLASLRRPPVLAFATVTMLLGGAVVLSSHREELEVKSAAVSGSRREAASAPAESAELAVADGGAGQGHGRGAGFGQKGPGWPRARRPRPWRPRPVARTEASRRATRLRRAARTVPVALPKVSASHPTS